MMEEEKVGESESSQSRIDKLEQQLSFLMNQVFQLQHLQQQPQPQLEEKLREDEKEREKQKCGEIKKLKLKIEELEQQKKELVEEKKRKEEEEEKVRAELKARSFDDKTWLP